MKFFLCIPLLCTLVGVRFSGCFAALWKEVCGKAMWSSEEKYKQNQLQLHGKISISLAWSVSWTKIKNQGIGNTKTTKPKPNQTKPQNPPKKTPTNKQTPKENYPAEVSDGYNFGRSFTKGQPQSPVVLFLSRIGQMGLWFWLRLCHFIILLFFFC